MLQLDLGYLRDLLTTVGRDEQLTRFEQVSSQKKADGSLVTEADINSQRLIQQALQEKWPETAFLGEEMSPEEQLAAMSDEAIPLWVLDPLDGTTNYAGGIPFFGISLALVESGEVRFGMVYDPSRDECFWAEKGKGTWLNDKPLTLNDGDVEDLAECVALLDFKRLEDQVAIKLVTIHPYRSQRSLGSVALEWCWLAAGRFQLYLHGGQRLWDYGAGKLIFREAGGAVGGEDEKPPVLKPQQGLAASNERLLKNWTDFLFHH